MQDKERHVLALSGGKDSAALAVYMREKRPDIRLDYIFTDTGCELPETYEYLERIKAILNIEIITIKPKKSWESYWSRIKVKKTKNGTYTYLPSPKNRWCTEVLKLLPYDRWISDNYKNCLIYSYVGLRADEKKERKGFLAPKSNIVQNYPFIEDGLAYEDIKYLLLSSGINFPAYYNWRKRSGCYFCFYQTKMEWLGLYENHPDLFKKAQSFEMISPDGREKYTWCDDMSLEELVIMKKKIMEKYENHDGGYLGEKITLRNKLSKVLSSLDLSIKALVKEK